MLLADSLPPDGPEVRRLARDGLVVVAPCAALASDVAATPEARAVAIASCLPRGALLTGAAALWVLGFGSSPLAITVAVRRGAHPDAPAACGGHRWRFMTDGAAHEAGIRCGTISLAPPARCAAVALAESPWPDGVALADAVVRAGIVKPRDITVALQSLPHTAQRTRAEAALAALAQAEGWTASG